MTQDMNLIVFDWDGTLMDSEARIVECMHAAIHDTELPHRDDEQVRNIIGLGLYEALNVLFPDGSEDDYQRLIERYRHHFLISNETPSELFVGAKELIEHLHQAGHFLAVATGKGRKGLDKVLDETGLDQYFHYTRCADETHSKPHPQMLHDIMDRLGIEAINTVMIGDTEYDMQMANSAGVNGVAVSYGVHDKARLLACDPVTCVDSLDELKQWLLSRYNNAA